MIVGFKSVSKCSKTQNQFVISKLKLIFRSHIFTSIIQKAVDIMNLFCSLSIFPCFCLFIGEPTERLICQHTARTSLPCDNAHRSNSKVVAVVQSSEDVEYVLENTCFFPPQGQNEFDNKAILQRTTLFCILPKGPCGQQKLDPHTKSLHRQCWQLRCSAVLTRLPSSKPNTVVVSSGSAASRLFVHYRHI